MYEARKHSEMTSHSKATIATANKQTRQDCSIQSHLSGQMADITVMFCCAATALILFSSRLAVQQHSIHCAIASSLQSLFLLQLQSSNCHSLRAVALQ